MNSVDKLVKRILSVEGKVQALASTPRLANSSVEDGAIDVNDAEGNPMMSIGQQFDGTHVAATLSGPTPPTPTAARLTAGIESLTVAWDGVFLNEEGVPDEAVIAPMDFSRVEVHVSADPTFEPVTAETLRGTIETPRGTDVVVTPISGGPFYVRLVARSLSGKPGAGSPAVAGTTLPEMPVDLLPHQGIREEHLAAGAVSLEKLDQTMQETMALVSDNDSELAAATGRLSAAESDLEAAFGRISTAEQTLEVIPVDISNAKTEAINTAASDAASKANTAKSEAISAAATDAATKAGTAKSEAISAAADDATTKTNGVKAIAEKAAADALTAAGLAGSKGRVWFQPASPNAGRTRRWVGAANASVSQELLDGVLQRTNLFPYTSFETSTTITGVSNVTRSLVTTPADVVAGTSAMQLACINSGVNTYVGQYADGLTEGQHFAFGINMRHVSGSKYARLAIIWRTAANANVGTASYTPMIELTGTSLRYSHSGTVPATATRAYCLAYFYNTPAAATPTAGSTWTTDAWHAQVAPTLADAIKGTDSFFDGSSHDDRSFDLWVNTGDKNKPHRWDAATDVWVQSTDQAAVDAAIAAAKTETENQISTVNNQILGQTYYGTAVPTPTAPAGARVGSTYRQRDTNGVLQAEYEWTGATNGWVQRKLSGASLTAIDVGVLTAGSAAMQSAVVEKIAAATASIQKADIGNLTVTGTTNLADAVAQKIAANTGQFISLAVSQLTAGTGSMAVGVIDKLYSDVVLSRELIADEVKAGAIDGMEITGATIIGGLMKTADTGARLEISSDQDAHTNPSTIEFFGGPEDTSGSQIQAGWSGSNWPYLRMHMGSPSELTKNPRIELSRSSSSVLGGSVDLFGKDVVIADPAWADKTSQATLTVRGAVSLTRYDAAGALQSANLRCDDVNTISAGAGSTMVAGKFRTGITEASAGLTMTRDGSDNPVLWIKGVGNVSSNTSALFRTSTGDTALRADATKNLVLGSSADRVQLLDPPTSTFSANVGIASNPKDILYKLTSAAKYKLNVDTQTLEKAFKILDVDPKTWFDRFATEKYADYMAGEDVDLDDIAPLRRVPGVVAEDVEAAGLEEYVTYDGAGEIEGVAYDRLWTLLIPLVRLLLEEKAAMAEELNEQRQLLASLADRVAKLEAAATTTP